MLKCMAALLVALLAAAGCGGSDENAEVGNPAVFERIEAESDCVKLQSEFDTSMDNVERFEPGADERDVPLAYAKAAEDRMNELGC